MRGVPVTVFSDTEIKQLRGENEVLRRAIADLLVNSQGLGRDLPEPELELQGADATPATYASFITERYLPWSRATKRSAPWEEIILRCHLLPAFGPLRFDQIQRSAILSLVAEKKAAGYAKGTINRHLSVLKVTLAKAMEWEATGLKESPAHGIRLLKDPPMMERYLTPEEAQRLMREIRAGGSVMLPFIVPFLLFTGARKREALDARWRDIDFPHRLWTIPFTKSGKPRTVPLSDEAFQVLLALREKNFSDTYVFPNPDTGVPYVTIFHTWNRCRRAAGLADVRIHDLRHSFASALINNGMTIYDVKEALGHSNIVTTQRYSHLSPDRLRKAVGAAGAHYVGLEKSSSQSA